MIWAYVFSSKSNITSIELYYIGTTTKFSWILIHIFFTSGHDRQFVWCNVWQEDEIPTDLPKRMICQYHFYYWILKRSYQDLLKYYLSSPKSEALTSLHLGRLISVVKVLFLMIFRFICTIRLWCLSAKWELWQNIWVCQKNIPI